MVSRLILLLFKDLRSSAWNLKLHSNLLRLLSRPKLASWRLLRVTFKASPTTLHPLQLVEETAHNYKQKPYNSSLISSLISKTRFLIPHQNIGSCPWPSPVPTASPAGRKLQSLPTASPTGRKLQSLLPSPTSSRLYSRKLSNNIERVTERIKTLRLASFPLSTYMLGS